MTPDAIRIAMAELVFKGLTQEQKMRIERAIMKRLVRETGDAVTALEVSPNLWSEEILRETGKWKEGES